MHSLDILELFWLVPITLEHNILIIIYTYIMAIMDEYFLALMNECFEYYIDFFHFFSFILTYVLRFIYMNFYAYFERDFFFLR